MSLEHTDARDVTRVFLSWCVGVGIVQPGIDRVSRRPSPASDNTVFCVDMLSQNIQQMVIGKRTHVGSDRIHLEHMPGSFANVRLQHLPMCGPAVTR